MKNLKLDGDETESSLFDDLFQNMEGGENPLDLGHITKSVRIPAITDTKILNISPHGVTSFFRRSRSLVQKSENLLSKIDNTVLNPNINEEENKII